MFCVIMRSQYSGSVNINVFESLQTCAVIEGLACDAASESSVLLSPFHTQDACARTTSLVTLYICQVAIVVLV